MEQKLLFSGGTLTLFRKTNFTQKKRNMKVMISQKNNGSTFS